MFDRDLIHVDAAVAINKGKRKTQEDAILSDFTIGNRLGLVVLADGMGGHNAGDVASALVTTEVFRELRYCTPTMLKEPDSIPEKLWAAACKVNAYIRRHIAENPRAQGMGCTLVIAVQIGLKLYWLSVGDSPIYLLRDARLLRLNDDHSLAPQIDCMAQQGLLTPEQARTHPDRSMLTSAINGQEIRYVDCRETPLALRSGDTVIVASDGLCSLEPNDLVRVIQEDAAATCAQTSKRMLSAIRQADRPDQDNVCFAILQVSKASAEDRARIERFRAVSDASPAMAVPPEALPQPKRHRPLTRLLNAVGGRADP